MFLHKGGVAKRPLDALTRWRLSVSYVQTCGQCGDEPFEGSHARLSQVLDQASLNNIHQDDKPNHLKEEPHGVINIWQ